MSLLEFWEKLKNALLEKLQLIDKSYTVCYSVYCFNINVKGRMDAYIIYSEDENEFKIYTDGCSDEVTEIIHSTFWETVPEE